MHFSVFLFTGTQPSADEVGEIVYPYYVEAEVEPELYATYSEKDIADMGAPFGADHWDLLDVEDRIFEFAECEGFDEPVRNEDGSYSVYDSRNPNALWDWFEIGGRFEGAIPGGANSAQLGDLDFAAVVRERMEDDTVAFFTYQEQAARLPEVPRTAKGDFALSPQELRGHPRIALANSIIGEGALTPMERLTSLVGAATVEQFLDQQTYDTVPYGYVDLTGTYHDRDAVDGDYAEQYLQYRDSLPGSVWLTVLDWHF